jgi:hypothetical protein
MANRQVSNNGYPISSIYFMFRYTYDSKLSKEIIDNRDIYNWCGVIPEIRLDVGPMLLGSIDYPTACGIPRDWDLDKNLPESLI